MAIYRLKNFLTLSDILNNKLEDIIPLNNKIRTIAVMLGSFFLGAEFTSVLFFPFFWQGVLIIIFSIVLIFAGLRKEKVENK